MSQSSRGPTISQILNSFPFYFWEVCVNEEEKGEKEMHVVSLVAGD